MKQKRSNQSGRRRIMQRGNIQVTIYLKTGSRSGKNTRKKQRRQTGRFLNCHDFAHAGRDVVNQAGKIAPDIIITAQLHSTKPELRFCTGSNPARSVSEIRDGEDL